MPKSSYSSRIFHVLTEDANYSRQTQEILQRNAIQNMRAPIYMEPKMHGNFS